MKKLSEMTEEELRDYKVPWPKTQEELLDIITQLENREQTYGTCVYSISISTTATFYYMSSKLRITGFQASCADMDILKRLRCMEDGFMIIDYKDLLYPQYNNLEHFPTYDSLINKNIKHLVKQAKRLLSESPNASPNVKNHWKYIVSLEE